MYGGVTSASEQLWAKRAQQHPHIPLPEYRAWSHPAVRKAGNTINAQEEENWVVGENRAVSATGTYKRASPLETSQE